MAGSRRTAPYQVLAQEQALYYSGQADRRVHCLAYQPATEAFGHTVLPVPHEAAAPGRAEAALAQGSLALNPAGDRLTYVGHAGRSQGYYRPATAAAWRHYWLDDYWEPCENAETPATCGQH